MSSNQSAKKTSNKRRKTYLRMLRSIACAILVVIIVLIVLEFFGINVSSMLAGVGIASIIIGFALQDALKDNPSGQGGELTPFILIRPVKENA